MAEVADELHMQIVDELGGVDRRDHAGLHRLLQAGDGGQVDPFDEALDGGAGRVYFQQLPGQQASVGGMLGEVGVDLVEQVGDALPHAVALEAAGQELVHDRGHPAHRLVQHRAVERLLGFEVVEDRRLVCLGLVGDLLDRDARVPPPRE